MRRTAIALLGASLFLTSCQSSNEREGNEVKLRLDDVPPAVRATILREAGGAPVTEVEREEENGRVVYEAEITTNGRQRDIEVDAQGNLLPPEAGDYDQDDEEDED